MRSIFIFFFLLSFPAAKAQPDSAWVKNDSSRWQSLTIKWPGCPFVKNVVFESGRIFNAYYSDKRMIWFQEIGLNWHYHTGGAPANVSYWPVSRKQQKELQDFGLLSDSAFFFWGDSSTARHLHGSFKQHKYHDDSTGTNSFVLLKTVPFLAEWDTAGSPIYWCFPSDSGAVCYGGDMLGRLSTIEHYRDGERIAAQSWYDNGAIYLCSGFYSGEYDFEAYEESGELYYRYKNGKDVLTEPQTLPVPEETISCKE